jgi:tetratricopeptide (TPR) repeat protein
VRIEQLTAEDMPPVQWAGMFEVAVRDLATALDGPAESPGVDWLSAVPQVTPPDFDDPARRNARTQQIRALSGLVRAAGAAGRPVLDAVLDDLVRGELEYAEGTAIANEISFNTPTVLDRCVAAAALFGAATLAEARTVVRAVLGLAEGDHELAYGVASWLRELYPNRSGDYWGAVEPVELVQRLLVADRQQLPVVAGVLGRVSERQARRALTTLRAVTLPDRQLERALVDALGGCPGIAPIAVEVAGAGETPTAAILLRGAVAAMSRPGVPLNDVEAVLDRLASAAPLWESRDPEAVGHLVDNLRRLSRVSTRYQPYFARMLRHEAVLLIELGRHEEALGRLTEAIEVYRRLVERAPDYRNSLVNTLRAAAVQLRQLGRYPEASTMDREAELIRQRGEPGA